MQSDAHIYRNDDGVLMVMKMVMTMAIVMGTEKITAVVMRMTIVIGVVTGRKMAALERYVQKCTLMRCMKCIIAITRCPLTSILTKTQIILSNMK